MIVPVCESVPSMRCVASTFARHDLDAHFLEVNLDGDGAVDAVYFDEYSEIVVLKKGDAPTGRGKANSLNVYMARTEMEDSADRADLVWWMERSGVEDDFSAGPILVLGGTKAARAQPWVARLETYVVEAEWGLGFAVSIEPHQTRTYHNGAWRVD